MIFSKNIFTKFIIVSTIINLFVILNAKSQNKALIAPDFTIISTQNDTFNLYTELGKGKAVILDFFSLYCAPCQMNTDDLDAIYRSYGSGDSLLWVWGIESENGTNAEVDTFKAMFGASFPGFSSQYLDNDTILSLYNITYTPIYYFVCTDTTTKPLTLSQLPEALESCIGPPYINNISENIISDFRIYPNPASKSLTLTLSKGEGIASQIKGYSITDIYGRIVKQLTINQSNNLTIEVEDLIKGIYFLKIQTENGFVVKKFMKN